MCKSLTVLVLLIKHVVITSNDTVSASSSFGKYEHARMHTRTHAQTHIHNHLIALWILSGITQVSWYQKQHSPTHTYPDHQLSFICFFHLCDPQQRPCSIYVSDSLSAQPLSKSYLVYLLVWHPQLHNPYISSPNHCLLFATHAHINI